MAIDHIFIYHTYNICQYWIQVTSTSATFENTGIISIGSIGKLAVGIHSNCWRSISSISQRDLGVHKNKNTRTVSTLRMRMDVHGSTDM
jgi:hypothetical protein